MCEKYEKGELCIFESAFRAAGSTLLAFECLRAIQRDIYIYISLLFLQYFYFCDCFYDFSRMLARLLTCGLFSDVPSARLLFSRNSALIGINRN